MKRAINQDYELLDHVIKVYFSRTSFMPKLSTKAYLLLNFIKFIYLKNSVVINYNCLGDLLFKF